MKKLFTLALALVLGVAALVGCGKKSDWDYIKGKGEMIIGITYYAPMNYKDADGKLIGFDTELAEAVCAELGVTPKFQEIEWSAKETELAAKNIDAIWNGMTKTEERAQNMTLSQSYLKNAPVIIVRQDKVELYQTAEDLNGVSAIAESGSMAADILQGDPFFALAQKTLVDTQMKTFLELKSNTADLAVSDYVAAIGSIGEGTDFAELVVSPYKTFDGETYAIAFRKGDDSVSAQVNAVLDKFTKDGTIESIAAKYRLETQVIK